MLEAAESSFKKLQKTDNLRRLLSPSLDAFNLAEKEADASVAVDA